MIVVDYIRKLVTTIWLRRKCSFYIYKFVIYFKDGKCRYKGITYHRGETWTDGCDYDCECVDGHTGRYSCTNR